MAYYREKHWPYRRGILEEVEDFFHRFYAPDNAILSISGNITDEKALELVKNGSGTFLPPVIREKALPMEPQQPKSVASYASITKFGRCNL